MTPWVEAIEGDCLDVMPTLEAGSVDMILTDLPYGTTAHAWDVLVPFEPLWHAYRRLLKPNRAVVLTASQPFTSLVVASNPDWFRYGWVWVKNRPTNFAHAKNKPMKKHEDILVFSSGSTGHATQTENRMLYNPQGLQPIAPKKVTKRPSEKTDAFFSDRPSHGEFIRDTTGYPNSVLEFPTDQMGLHPTQKPVALIEYLIRTYTNPGDTVLCSCFGSGTVGVAARNTGRNCIGIEKDPHYYEVACNRLWPDEEAPK